MYNWADYVDPDNIEKFKTDFGSTSSPTTPSRRTRRCSTKLQGGATGQYDIGAPTAEFVAAMVDGRLPPEDRLVEAPERGTDRQAVPGAYWWRPRLNNYHLPKDWGTTGIAHRTKVVKDEVKTWRKFFDVAPKYSGKIVVVNSPGDVFVAPLKAHGYSLNSVDPKELERGARAAGGLAPHVLALDSDTYDASSRTRRPSWASSGPAASSSSATRRRPRTPSTSSPRTGRCTGWTRGSSSRTRPTRTPRTRS